jgi:restriction endonuclease S subunit
MIPKNWVSRELGEIAEFVNGRGFKPHEWSNNGLPIIRIQNLNGSSEFNYYSGTYDPKIEIHSGDLLFAWSGSRGTSFGPHFWSGGKAVLNYHTWRVVPTSKEIDKRFLYDALKLLTARIEDEAHGAAALVHTQKNRIVTYSIWLPPVSEQRKIAAILSTWDRAIELTEKLIAAKQQRKAALMQQLLTGKVRLPGFRSTHWRPCELGDVASNSTRRNGTSTPPPVYSVTNSVGMVPMDESVVGESIDRYKAVAKYDFAYNPMRINVGSIAMWDGDEEVLVSPDYVVFRCGPDLDPEFLNHYRTQGNRTTKSPGIPWFETRFWSKIRVKNDSKITETLGFLGNLDAFALG